MSLSEIVKDKNKVINVVIRKNIKVNGIEFSSSKNYSFQVSFHNREKGTLLKLLAKKYYQVLAIQPVFIKFGWYKKKRYPVTEKLSKT